MAGKWIDTSLGNVVELKRGYDLPQQNRRPGIVPIVSSSGVSDHHAEAIVKGPGVVTGRYGTLGQVFLITEDYWPLNTTLYVRDFKGNDPRFISYFLRVLDFLPYSDKAAVPGLNRNHLHQALVHVPSDVTEQRAIAQILGTLDDKIEVNRRMSATLEAMARALFKSWFVDFEPVRAKSQGRAPGLPPHLAALFPARLVETEHGEVPEGWRRSPLLNHARLISGGTPKTIVADYWSGHIAWASAKDVSQCREPFLVVTERSISEKGLLESSARMVPRHATVVVARGATTGRFCMFGREIAMNQTCYALASLQGRPFWLNCAFAVEVGALVHAAHGSAFDTITTNTIERARATVSEGHLEGKFEATVGPVFGRILASIEESRMLAALRDTLLPKLISGEIRVKDAERALASVPV